MGLQLVHNVTPFNFVTPKMELGEAMLFQSCLSGYLDLLESQNKGVTNCAAWSHIYSTYLESHTTDCKK